MAEKIKRLEDFDEYVKAQEKLTRLKVMLNEVETAKVEALSTLAESRKTTPVQEVARVFLESDSMDPIAVHDTEARAKEYKAVVKRWAMLTEAIRLQSKEVAKIQAALSKEIIEQLRPGYTKRVREILGAARNLSRLLADEKDFRDELTQAGIHHVGLLPTLANLHIGLLNDPNSRINHFIKTLAVDGYITPGEVEVLTCVK